jgi:hypothetical protein
MKSMDQATCDSPRIRRTAWLVWISIAVVVSLVVLLDRKERSVTPSYRNAVIHWFAGEPLYNGAGSGFIYLPQAALAFAPWGLLPKPVGEVAWRWSILAVLAAGVYRWTRVASTDDRWFLINSVATAATAVGCARNGQSTLMITGLMLLATVDLQQRQWGRAALLLVLAFAFKPVAIVLMLLAAALYRPMISRLAVGMAFVAVAPFLTQSPGYVVSQFAAFYQNTGVAFADGETGYWAQLFGMFKVAGLDVSSSLQQASRLACAALTLVACGLAARRLPQGRNTFYLYALSNCYLMLFNSRTEGSTYAMVGPVYGVLLAEAWLQRRRLVPALLFGLAIVATVFNYDLARLATRRPNHDVWLCPFVCVLVTIYLAARLVIELRSPASVSQIVPAEADRPPAKAA